MLSLIGLFVRYFCEGAYFIRIEFKLVRNHADGSENICVRGIS